MIALLWRMKHDEDGQALVLGAVVVLVLALAVLGTAPIARAVHDRIRLQDAADASAYTLAAQEARAFNFYAYSNRAQISQYVAAMQLVSTDAFMLFVYSIMGIAKALVDTLGSVCNAGICGKALCELPIIGEALEGLAALAAGFDAAADALKYMVEAFDSAVGQALVPLIQAANRGVYLLDQTYKLAIEAKLAGDEDVQIARATAPDASSMGSVSEALRVANLAAFRGAHEAASEEIGRDIDPSRTSGDDGAQNRARRAMGELVMATRFDSWVYDRSLPQALAAMAGGGLNGSEMGALTKLQDWGVIRKLPGSTRLISQKKVGKPGDRDAPYDNMEHNGGYGWGSYPVGDALVANQYFDMGSFLGPLSLIPGLKDAFQSLTGMQGYASVVTTDGEDQSAGWHCGWKGTMTHINLNCIDVSIPDLGCTDEGGHPWQGLTPYMSFASDASFASGQNQPDVWVAIEAPRSAARGKVGGSAVDVEVNTPTGVARARSADAGDRVVDGMAAVARATAYYHRPGNWHEPPNFWNPFWRAKLAPVEPGLERIPALGQLLGKLPGGTAERLVTH